MSPAQRFTIKKSSIVLKIQGPKSTQKFFFNTIVVGVRMLDGKATDALEASSLGFQLQYVDIFSNCWGPKDDGKTFGKPGPLAAKALKRGAETVNSITNYKKVSFKKTLLLLYTVSCIEPFVRLSANFWLKIINQTNNQS